MFRYKRNQPVRIWTILSLGLFLAASCGPVEVTPAPDSTRLPPCSPGDGNFYTASNDLVGIQNQKVISLANNIYSLYLNNPNDLELARSESINFLAYETWRWSHVEDVTVDRYYSAIFSNGHSAGRYAVPASVRGSRLKPTFRTSPKGFHALRQGFSPLKKGMGEQLPFSFPACLG